MCSFLRDLSFKWAHPQRTAGPTAHMHCYDRAHTPPGHWPLAPAISSPSQPEYVTVPAAVWLWNLRWLLLQLISEQSSFTVMELCSQSRFPGARGTAMPWLQISPWTGRIRDSGANYCIFPYQLSPLGQCRHTGWASPKVSTQQYPHPLPRHQKRL